ncbi:MAG: DUF2723 domain-containing protein [bacterium]
MPGPASSARRALLPLAAFLLPLLLYFLTACRDIYWMDTTELALCGRFLLVPHPPGYPLLTLLVRLSALVSPAPLAFNLVSAIAAAGSCLVLYLIVVRLAGDRMSAFAAALLWAVSFELWQQATALEVYALGALLAGLVVLACLEWHATGDARHLLAAGLSLGLALANHLTALLVVPGLLLVILRPDRRLTPGLAAAALACTALPLALYVIVPLRAVPSAPGGWGGIESVRDLWAFVSGSAYRYRLLAGSQGYLPSQLAAVPAAFGRQFLLGWLFVPIGAAALWAAHRRVLLALLLGIALSAGFALAYNIPDKEGYFLVAYLLTAALAGAGIARLGRTRLRRGAVVAALAVAVLQGTISYRGQDRSRHDALSSLSQAVLTEVPPGAVLVTDDYSVLQALRWLGTRSALPFDVVSEHHLAFGWYIDWLALRLPIPTAARSLSDKLWFDSQPRGVEFGELARRTVTEQRRLLVAALLPGRRVFWLAKDFGEWTEEWAGYRLLFRGLTNEFSARESTVGDLPTLDWLPSPAVCAGRRADNYAEDVCRRYAATFNRRGILRFSREDASGAQADFDRALGFFTDYPGAIENKGLVYYFSGQPDSARRYLERFAALEPESPELQRIRPLLERLKR